MNNNNVSKKKNHRVIDTVLYRIFGITDDDDIIVENMERASRIFDRIFRERMDKVADVDAKRMQVKDGLSDENKFLAMNPNTQLIQLIIDTYNVECKNNLILFMRSLRAKRNGIRQRFNGELAEFVLRELERTEREFGPEGSFEILLNLYLKITKNPDRNFVIGLLTTPPGSDKLRDSINRLKNAKVKSRIIKAIAGLANDELKYLIIDFNQIKGWENKESVQEDVPFFDGEINSMIDGGRGYKGIRTDLNDEALALRIRSNPFYLQINGYRRFLFYLVSIRNILIKNPNDPFEGFNEVWNKIEEHANRLKRFFGATETVASEIADYLLELKKSGRQFPQELLNKFNEWITNLSDRRYRQSYIVMPFIKAMEGIFSARIRELGAQEKSEVSDLKDALQPIIKSEKYSADNILEKSTRAKKRMRKRIESLRFEFEYLSDNYIDSLLEFIEAKTRIVHQDLRREILVRLINGQYFSRDVKKYVSSTTQVMGSDLETSVMNPIKGAALLFALDKASRVAEGVSHNLRSIGKLFSKKTIKKKIDELNQYMENCEKDSEVLIKFIEANLGFLLPVKGEQENRRDENGRRYAA